MRYTLLIYLPISILILTCSEGCPLFNLLVTSKKKENINPEKFGEKETLLQRNSSISTMTTPIKAVSPCISTLKNTNKKGDDINKKKEGISYTNSNTEESPKKKAQNFIIAYLKYTSKQANFNNDYSLKNYNDFKGFIEKFINDAFNDIDKTETGLFLYYSIIAFFDTIRSSRSGTYSREFGDSIFVKEEMNVRMRNLILLKLLCDILDLNVISQHVTVERRKDFFYTFISSFNIKSLFNYLTPSNFSKFFFDEDYFKKYKGQLENLKKYRKISDDDTAFYENNVVIRAFLNKFEVFKINNPDINECKDMFSLESLDKFFVFVRKMIFNTSHLFMMFLYEKFDDCFLPLEQKSLTVAINSEDDFSKILNEGLKENTEAKKGDDLYKESFYNDAAKNCLSVIRNTIIVLNTINPISDYVTKKKGGLIKLNYNREENQTLKDRMGIAPLECLLTLIEKKNEIYTKSNKLTSLCNLYGQHKFLHYYLVKDNKNTIFPIQNKFHDGSSFLGPLGSKEKLIFKRYQKIFERIEDYDDIRNFKVMGDQSGFYPKVSQKRNSLFKTIIYK